MIIYSHREGETSRRKEERAMKKVSMKGINAKVNAVIRKNPNATPAEMDKALKALAKEMGITWKALRDWMAEHIG
jgi:hypothetical protein